jgi:Inhibitor of Apoptosis domain
MEQGPSSSELNDRTIGSRLAELLADRQIDLKNPEDRLRTYSKWPLSNPTPQDLARAGFFYFDVGDQVKCVFCGGIIGQWEENDQPHKEHQKFFPNCPMVRQQEEQQEEIGIQRVRTPKYAEFSTLESRIRSFSTWDSSVQNPTILAQAGFFYLGTSDEVRDFLKLKLF